NREAVPVTRTACGDAAATSQERATGGEWVVTRSTLRPDHLRTTPYPAGAGPRLPASCRQEPWHERPGCASGTARRRGPGVELRSGGGANGGPRRPAVRAVCGYRGEVRRRGHPEW